MKSNKVVYLTNAPAPYREKMHEILSNYLFDNYSVIYCTELEPNRTWKLDYGKYKKVIFTKKATTFKHSNKEIWQLLTSVNPDVIIISGFVPTMIYGFLWSLFKRKKIIVSLDGTFQSEACLSIIHKLIRHIVFSFSKAFVAPSNGTVELFKSYGIKEERISKSPLCIANEMFKSPDIETRAFDIMFSGQMIKRKMPLFFVEVAILLKNKLPDLKILLLGDGELQEPVIQELDKNKLDYHFAGFLKQDLLPEFYSKTKLFLFPSLNDPWGIVANEACASGTPVITCDNVGAANDLIVHGVNGYILPLKPDVWAEYIYNLLQNRSLLKNFSINAKQKVQSYNHKEAANGVMKAVKLAISS